MEVEVCCVEHMPKPLSPMKVADIMRVAKRMKEETGSVDLSELQRKCCHRLPGSLARYTMSFVKSAQRYFRT